MEQLTDADEVIAHMETTRTMTPVTKDDAWTLVAEIRRLRADRDRVEEHIVVANEVAAGDVIYASYHAPRLGGRCCDGKEELVSAWVVVNEVKHHTESTVTFFSSPEGSPERHRWVEYPRTAPIVARLAPSPPATGEPGDAE